MQLLPANINTLFTAFETRFWTALDTTPVWNKEVADTYPAPTEFWQSAWLDMIDKSREWIGPRVVHTPAPVNYTVQIQNWELTEAVDLFKVQDDLHGIYNPIVSMMATSMKKTPDFQLRDLLQNQGSQTLARQICYDGLTFFNTAHPVDYWDASKGTYANDLTGGGVVVNGTTIGGQLTNLGFSTAYQDMVRQKTAMGEAWGVVPSHVLNGPMLKQTADTLLQAQFLGAPVVGVMGAGNNQTAGQPAVANGPMVGASTNMLKGWAEELMIPDLGGPGTVGNTTFDFCWYLGDFKKAVKPLIWLLNQAANFVPRTRLDDPVVFDTHTLLYGSTMRASPTYSFPQLLRRSSA
jgi:phage major head subunit gpT-like protein